MLKKKSVSIAISVILFGPPLSYAGNQFNPDISLILDGRYNSFSNDSDYELPGFMLGGEAGRGEKGFQLGHNELLLSANIDDMYYGKMTTVLADHDGETEVELEEAYIETLGLGAGTAIKAGRFFSGIGYLNNQHPHSWDFTDAPLVYRGLFGDTIRDDGVQLSWVAPTDIYLKLGAEVTRGDKFPAGGAANDGAGAHAAFIKIGGDVGISNSWQLGLTHWSAEVEDRTSGGHLHGGDVTGIPTYSGNSTVNGVDFVWKWAPNGNAGESSLKIQAEYFVREEDGTVEMVAPDAIESSNYDGEQSGWYAQAVYQFMPRWRVGVRHDQLESDNRGNNELVLAKAGLDDEGHDPSRSTIMLDYSRSEYSRIRLQYSQDDSYEESDNIIILQYVMSLGAHGAHQF